ncbi:MAG: diguanylate cyclase [Gammaproteobacteria bacterium]|nr:diguanylate cyclase [Gammaproteobacteria bacterium]
MLKNSLQKQLYILYLLMITCIVTFEVLYFNYVQLPEKYLIEARADSLDIKRIKTAFATMSNELKVTAYDNAVWDDIYNFIENRKISFINKTYSDDVFRNLSLTGVYIYDQKGAVIWDKSIDENNKKTNFKPFDLPSDVVNKYILQNSLYEKELAQSGYIILNNKLVLFSASKVYKENLKGKANGTLVFWRFVNNKVLEKLQNSAGLYFDIQMLKSERKTLALSHSLGKFRANSYRMESGIIFDSINLVGDTGRVRVSYNAPSRQFEVNWFKDKPLIKILVYLLILSLFTLFIQKIFVKPIVVADKTVSNIIDKNLREIRINSRKKDELGDLFNQIDRLLEDIESQEQMLLSHHVKLEEISKTDGLTKIANRRAYDMYMDNLFKIRQIGVEVSILIGDVDFFKKYNDHYGHAKGDHVLRLIAETLQGNIHSETDFLARYGGEEFVVILKNTDQEKALSVANNLIQSIRGLKIPHIESQADSFVTMSFGVHTFLIKEKNRHKMLFESADKALYMAKDSGRNRVCHSI